MLEVRLSFMLSWETQGLETYFNVDCFYKSLKLCCFTWKNTEQFYKSPYILESVERFLQSTVTYSGRLVFWRIYILGDGVSHVILSECKQIMLGDIKNHDIKAAERQSNIYLIRCAFQCLCTSLMLDLNTFRSQFSILPLPTIHLCLYNGN